MLVLDEYKPPEIEIIYKNGKKYLKTFLFDEYRELPCMTEEEEREWEDGRRRVKEYEEQREIEKLKLNSMIDDKFKENRFEKFEITKENEYFYNLTMAYAKNYNKVLKDNTGLILYGPPGVGKSFMSFCIANYLLDNGMSVIAMTSNALIAKIKEVSGFGNSEESKFIKSIQKAKLLIIDDLGGEHNSEWSKSKLYEVIDARYRSGRPLIITTNLNLKQLKDHLTGKDGMDRSVSRIKEMCKALEVNIRPIREKKANYRQQSFDDVIGKNAN